MFLGLPDPHPDTLRYGSEDPDPYQNVTDPEHWPGSTIASVLDLGNNLLYGTICF